MTQKIEKENVLLEIREYFYEGGRYKIAAKIQFSDMKVEMEGGSYSDIVHTVGHILLAITDYVHQPPPEA